MAANLPEDDDMISTINVTPFVDVVLVLLVALMITSTQIVRAQLMVELPEAASGGDAVPSTLNVTLLASGELLLDGSPSSLGALASAVRAEKATDPEVQAVIAADKGVPYGKVVEVIDTVKTNGVTSFALNIERTSSASTE